MSALDKIVLLKLNDKRDVFTTVPKSMQHEVKKQISSEFVKGTRDTIRGCDLVQERVYLPNILGIQANDPTFPLKAKDFWSDYTITPTVEGIRLNIGTTKSVVPFKTYKDGQEITEQREVDIPIDWDSYIMYHFALASSRVAKTSDELQNIEMYDFYMINLEDERKKETSEFEIRDKADGFYVRLTIDNKWEQNLDKINWILEIMKDNRFSSSEIEALSNPEKKMLLFKHKNEKPSTFISVYEDENLEHKAFLNKCVSNRCIIKEGNSYFNGDENIGSEQTVTAWFKNPVNSGKLLQLRARLEQVVKDGLKN